MNNIIWKSYLSELIRLQEDAAKAIGSESGKFEEDLVQTEEAMRLQCVDMEILTLQDAQAALVAAHDICTVEALAPMRDVELPTLIGRIKSWIDSLIVDGSRESQLPEA